MTQFNEGDRVHVEFDGTVHRQHALSSSGRLRVTADDGFTNHLRLEYCTLIAPPVKVGDIVDESNIDRIPVFSVTLSKNEGAYQLQFDGKWYAAGNIDTEIYKDTLIWIAPRVIHVGGED